jgi:GH24 family phage-related lysozyme (muramidase)
MNIDTCKQQIKRHEGEVLNIYEDSLGYKTLGIGHLCQPQDPEYTYEVGTKISQEVVDKYFKLDFDKHYKETIYVYGTQESFNKLPEDVQHVLICVLI